MSENIERANESISNSIDTSEMDGKYLTFWTDKQFFGVPIADVIQIIGMQKITVVPEFPSYAKGIINLRGIITSLIDVRLRFNKEEVPYNERTCIIVTSINDTAVGFIVDEVDEVTDIAPNDISEPPSISGDRTSTYLTGVARHENKVVLLVNTAKMLSDDDVEIFTSSAIA